MFAQANSEHCRHKIFNADWRIDGIAAARSPFAMIRHTKDRSPAGVLSAYSDNSAVIEGPRASRFFPSSAGHEYAWHDEPVDILLKVETHNHPTAISPFPGAATGSGGEIRDEGATGRGAKPKAGLVGFTVSNLRIPGFVQPWETDNGQPARIASALEIMLEGPIGAAAFNNEFGRPGILGYFRSYEQRIAGEGGTTIRGYHKPIMIAGGLGSVRRMHVEKKPVPARAPLVLLGGPAMLIGLGGGAASSQGSGAGSEQLDFASVQRGNPEMQRRAQQVIDACWAMGEDNPILMIHDVGAGGLSNAVPEVVAPGGGRIELSRVPVDEPGMSPLEIWCNEAQERYVLAEHPELEASDPEPVSVGGLDGFEVEIAIAPTSTNTPAMCPSGEVCVDLFAPPHLGFAWRLVTRGDRARMILLATADGAGTVLIAVDPYDHLGTDLEAFDTLAEPLLDSIDFTAGEPRTGDRRVCARLRIVPWPVAAGAVHVSRVPTIVQLHGSPTHGGRASSVADDVPVRVDPGRADRGHRHRPGALDRGARRWPPNPQRRPRHDRHRRSMRTFSRSLL